MSKKSCSHYMESKSGQDFLQHIIRFVRAVNFLHFLTQRLLDSKSNAKKVNSWKGSSGRIVLCLLLIPVSSCDVGLSFSLILSGSFSWLMLDSPFAGNFFPFDVTFFFPFMFLDLSLCREEVVSGLTVIFATWLLVFSVVSSSRASVSFGVLATFLRLTRTSSVAGVALLKMIND